MYQVIKYLDFCYGHRLMNYEGKCRHLHGHNARLEVVLQQPQLDSLGMVMDFKEIKCKVKAWVDEHMDHKMVLCKDDPLVPVLQAQGEPLCLLATNPTAENIAKHLFDVIHSQGVPVVKVGLWEADSSYAAYEANR